MTNDDDYAGWLEKHKGEVWSSPNIEQPMSEDEINEMIQSMFEHLIDDNEEVDMLPGVNKKLMPKGVDPDDFIKYMEECISGDLPCKLCLKGSTSYFTTEQILAGDVPWFKCGHAFIYGPLTPMKQVITSKLKIAKKKKKKKQDSEHEEETSLSLDADDWITSAFNAGGEGIPQPQQSPWGIAPKKKKKLPHPMKPKKKITLGDEQAESINLNEILGPEGEKFQDPDWEHCHNETCGSCYKHTLHHGIQHNIHNEDGHMISIWQQCINKHGEHDIFGNKITIADLKVYLYPETGMATPIQQQQIQQSQTNQQPIPTKEKKKMNYIIGAKLRARKILKVVERFDISWREKGEEGFYNTVRCSPFYLNQFLTVFLKNLLRKEAKKIFRMELDRLCSCLGETNTTYSSDIVNMVDDYYKLTKVMSDTKANLVEALTMLLGGMLNDVIDAHLTNGDHMRNVHRFKDSPISDPRDVMNLYINRGNSGVLDSVFLKAYLTYDNDEGTTLPLSQKARGIHAIGRNTTGLSMFTKLPSLHISLDAANHSTNRELIMSVSRAWMNTRAENTLSKGLYIRTCPETPRPGALPNVLAKTPRQYLDGIRMLGACMTDPNHIDYDPKGCLVVQQFIKPICSAVVVKDSNTFTIGPSNDGVTAGGGTNIVFTLNPLGVRRMEKDIERLDLEDGMEHHEIELVYDSASSGKHKTLAWFRTLADQRHQGQQGRIIPTITQMRGLHTAKPDLVPPPMVKGELLHIRGLIPMGSVKQLAIMDVGKGSLDECIELEQMAKKGELPEGLVVYAPSGTNAAHVAGVGGDFGFPVIFGIKPRKNHTVWTEIEGWVTDAKNVRPKPYDPQPMLDFYKIGLRDGDRFWTYNLAPLSQFFHNFISGPVNDPRLEAYLAGVYTTWIIKAALGVSMAEFRHGIGSDRADISMQRAFSHILIQQSIAGESGGRQPLRRWRAGRDRL